jgi:hypothetical protein
MTANREPSNQGFETDREATVCAASRRFFRSAAERQANARHALVGRFLFGSLSALGFWLFSNSGRALALPATDAAVLRGVARFLTTDQAVSGRDHPPAPEIGFNEVKC